MLLHWLFQKFNRPVVPGLAAHSRRDLIAQYQRGGERVPVTTELAGARGNCACMRAARKLREDQGVRSQRCRFVAGSRPELAAGIDRGSGRVITAGMPWVTTADTSEALSRSKNGSAFPHRVNKVLTAGGHETAVITQQRADSQLIGADPQN